MEKKMNYEQAMTALEKTVSELENENTDMDKAFALYEKGIKLVKYCEDYLDEKEKMIKQQEAQL